MPPTTTPHASVTFVEKPGDDRSIRTWDFAVDGLPAIDPRTGAIVVADLSHGNIVSSLALSIRWLLPGQREAIRTVVVLDDRDTSHALYDVDSVDEPAETAKLVVRVRQQTREANRIFAAETLHPLIACTLQSHEALGCVHPQRMTCGSFVAELDGDTLKWHKESTATKTSETQMGWSIPPMSIGDGPPKEMITCIEEAHVDVVTMRIAARINESCKGGGSDACYLPDEWRVATLH